jgi:lysozyme
MSFDRTDDHDESHGANASAAAAPAAGKRTQVELRAAPAAAGADHDDDHPKAAAASEPGGVDMKALEHFIGKHEGYVDHVYLDSRGFPTAGIGHLLAGKGYRVGQKVSAAQISAWFKQDVAGAISGAKKDIGPAYDHLNEARKMVVIDMVFNLGSAGFGGFHATIHAIQTGAYAKAAENMLQSLWAKQVGNRAVEDARIMRTGSLSGVDGGGGGGGGGHDDGGHGHSGGGGGGGGGANAPTLEQVRDGKGVLKVGEHGPSVQKVQHFLHVEADGIFGPHTQQAVEKFQRAHHLADDGIVGPKTLAALEHQKPANQDGDHGNKTGGAQAPGGGHGHGTHDDGGHGKGGKGGKKADGDWEPAPALAEVKSGAATLHKGEEGGSVRHVQKLLAVETDGKFGPATREAVADFQREHHMQRHDGAVDAHTLEILEKHPVGSVQGESRDGAAQRSKMLGIAHSGSAGRRPDGRCYYHVCQFLVQCGGYGKIRNPYTQFPSQYLPEAHGFADLMNSRGPEHFGLERLSMSSPYNAPSGSIVVVAAGSPGTHHPTAGDIAIADGHGNFYNGGMMGYSGPAGWNASPRAKLLGVYIPR